MLKTLLYNYYNFNLQKVYTENINRCGLNPNGVFWNSVESQYSRFEILLGLINEHSKKDIPVIADVGCGYAEFLNFLKKKKNFRLKYCGYDINSQLISYCKKRYPLTYFAVSNAPSQHCDFSIMSGTYNYSISKNIKLWEEYIFYNLISCFKYSRLGMIFNLQCANKSNIINNIYYTNVEKMHKRLKEFFDKVFRFHDSKAENDVFFVVLRS